METPKLLGLSHITNNSCHLLFSPKKVVPPKNIAHSKNYVQLSKYFGYYVRSWERKKRERLEAQIKPTAVVIPESE